MTRFASTLVAAVFLAGSSRAFSADPIDDALTRILTKEQYELLDVASMSDAQKQALITALRNAYAAGKLEAPAEPPPPNAAVPATSGEVVETKISGSFEGWEGETVVELMNGQIWQQSEYYYHYLYAFMPDVMIYPSGGGWKMKVEGVDKAVGVRRLQ